MLIADAFRILSEANEAIATLGSQYVDQANSPKQPKTLKELIRVRQLYNIINKFVFLNDAGTAITGTFGQNDAAINRLLLQLKRAARISTFPSIPNPIHFFVTESCCGSSLPVGASEGEFLYFHNSAWAAFPGGNDGDTLVWSPTGPVWSPVVGNGIPSGGSAGQFLIKNSNTSFDVVWDTLTLSQVTDVTSTAAELNVLDGVNTGSIGANQINTLVGINTGMTIQAQINSLLTNSLPDGQFRVGNALGVATAVTPTGDVTFNDTGLFDITAGAILNADVNASAGIARSKLASGSNNRLVINSSIGVMTDAAGITASRVLVSDTNGIPVASGVTTTQFAFYDISSSLQASLNARLTVNLTSPAQGDLIQFNGTDWVNFTVGAAGEVLTSDGTSAVWGSAAANGLPTGGTTNQYLRKIDATNYNTEWHTLVMADITNVSTTATELNLLAGLTVNSTLINYLTGATGNIQGQIGNKQDRALAYNAMWVGNAGNVASELSPGTDDYVLTMVGGAPQWQAPTPPGNVSGVAPSVDNAIVRWNGTAADSIQNSGLIIDDSNNLTFPTATAIQTSTSAGNTLLLRAYDVDGTAYTTMATMTANNTPTLDFITSATIGTAYIYRVGGTDVSLADGGTGASLADPGADRVMFWDDSLGAVTWLTMGSNLSISGTTLNATGGGSTLQQKSEPGATYSPSDADDGYIIYLTNSSGCLVTMPNTVTTDISVTFVRADGAGTITFQDDGTSALFTIGGELTIDYENGWVTWVKESTTNWYGAGALGVGGGGSGGVNSVSGTSNRITISGTASDPVVNIAATYVGQSSITTLGTIGTGVWQGTVVGTTYGGTGLASLGSAGQLIRVNAGATALEYFTPSYITGNQTITLSGDVSGSGTTSITTAIGTNKVLNTMIRQSAGLSVVGRSANSTGDVADVVGTAGQILRVSGTTLSFGSIDLSDSASVGSSILSVSNGGSGAATLTGLLIGNGTSAFSGVTIAQGDLFYGSASNTLTALAKNTSATRYLSNTGTSNNPAWAQIDLTNGVTGILPVANGGTGSSTAPYWALAGGGTLASDNALTGAFKIAFNNKGFEINQTAQSSGWLPTIKTLTGAMTSLTAATEFISYDWGTSSPATLTWATGTIARQRDHVFRGLVHSGANPTTFTTLYNVWIDKPTVSGTGVTVSQTYSLAVDGAMRVFGGDGTTQRLKLGTGGDFTLGSGSGASLLFDPAFGLSIGVGLGLNINTLAGAAAGQIYGLSSIGTPVNTTLTFNTVDATSTSSSQRSYSWSTGFAPTSGTATWVQHRFNPTINQTGGANGNVGIISIVPVYTAAGANVTGIDYDPTVTSISGTHLAWRNTSGRLLFGGSSLTAGSVLADFQSTTLGVLMPRVTNIASVATPVDGMIAYDAATGKFNFREASSWIQLTSGSISGLTSGRVPFANSSTTITDEAGFEYDSTNNLLSVPSIASTIGVFSSSNILKVSGALTRRSYEVLWADSTGNSGNSDIGIFAGYTDAIAEIEIKAVAIKNDGSEGYSCTKIATFRKDGSGTPVQVGSTTTVSELEDASTNTPSVTIAMNSTNVRVAYSLGGGVDVYRWTIWGKVTITEL